MMRLLCKGKALDLYDNAGLQFTKSNPAFAFGEFSAERTTQFKLPRTKTNDQVLALARIPAYNGEGMRRKFDAQLQSGIIVYDGFLYVSEFDGKDYSVIFVGGLAYDIKAFNNYGWGSLIFPSDDRASIWWNYPPYIPTTAVDADDSPSIVARVKYHSDSEATDDRGKYKPSIDLEELFTQLNTQGVFKITGLIGEHVRLIREEKSGIDQVLVRLVNGSQATAEDLDLSIENAYLKVGSMRIAIDDRDPEDPQFTVTSCFKATADMNPGCKITFQDNTPANLCMCTTGERVPGSDSYQLAFMGSRSFHYDANDGWVYDGEPLAGKTFDCDRDFILMTADGAIYENGYLMFIDYYGNMRLDQVPPYSVDVRVSTNLYTLGKESLIYRNVSVHSMLEGLNLGKLLLIYGACTGKLINVKGDGSVEFIDSLTPTNEELTVMKEQSLTRSFSNYARKNIIAFKENDLVQIGEKQSVEYDIDNDNIEEEKNLLTMEVDEGGLYNDGADNLVEIRGVETKYNFEQYEPRYLIKSDAVAVATVDNAFMEHVVLAKSNLLQSLCDASTTFKVQARMTMAKYARIDSATGFLVDGILYTWTDINWQNEIANITLTKIS